MSPNSSSFGRAGCGSALPLACLLCFAFKGPRRCGPMDLHRPCRSSHFKEHATPRHTQRVGVMWFGGCAKLPIVLGLLEPEPGSARCVEGGSGEQEFQREQTQAVERFQLLVNQVITTSVQLQIRYPHFDCVETVIAAVPPVSDGGKDELLEQAGVRNASGGVQPMDMDAALRKARAPRGGSAACCRVHQEMQASEDSGYRSSGHGAQTDTGWTVGAAALSGIEVHEGLTEWSQPMVLLGPR